MPDLPDDLQQQIRDAVLAGLEAATNPTPPSDPTKAPPVIASDVHLAQQALVRRGLSPGDAALQVLNSPLTSFEAEIAQERAYAQQNADREAAATYAASPEGRAAEAARIRAADATAAEMDLNARALLREQGWADDDLDAVSAEARAKAAGLIQEPVIPDTLESNLSVLSPEDRAFIESGGKF